MKDRKKLLRGFLQILILLGVGVLAYMTLNTLREYKPFTRETTTFAGDQGFVALSYFGVEYSGKLGVITSERLREHLTALQQAGYVTITQQDILDYYQKGKELPEKSLFLVFEDGRRDTAIFAQKIMEDLNFKATMLTYPEKFGKKDLKFLMPDELKDMEKNTYWEMGTNGYRLAFINVFDRHDNYLGEMSSLEHSSVAPYLGRKYNHYLMDYIRDEYGVPKESESKMKERISRDYHLLRESYTQQFGYVPSMYILMHSNTGKFGNNDKVSAVNEHWMKELFKMNFNREGFSFNRRNSSLYDLTRMQPQPYWYTNHLLMRIKYDINKELPFVEGNSKKRSSWEVRQGAMEFKDDVLILTALPKDQGLMRLKNSGDFADFTLSVQLKGNKLGLQKFYLRADETLQNYLAISLLNNKLYVKEKQGTKETDLYKLDLDQHDGKPVLSMAEDKKAAEVAELTTLAQYANSVEKTQQYLKKLQNKMQENPATVNEGVPAYLPEIGLSERGDRKLELALRGNHLSITVDGKEAIADLPLASSQKGSVYLASAWGGYGNSQRNLVDDVYDGVFDQLLITENTGAESERVLYDSRPEGMDGIWLKIKRLWIKLLNFFIKYL